MGAKGLIFLAGMAFLAFMWLQTKNRAQNEVITDLVEFSCKGHLLTEFENAIEKQKKDKAALIAQNRPGLEARAMEKRENLLPLKNVIYQFREPLKPRYSVTANKTNLKEKVLEKVELSIAILGA